MQATTPHHSRRALRGATLVLALAMIASLGCSSDPPKKVEAPPPEPPKAVDPHMEALKAKLARQKEDNARKDGERVGLSLVTQAEASAERFKPEEETAEETASAPDKKGGWANRPAIRNAAERDDGPAGTIDRGALSQSFRRYNNGLQNCYERGLKRNPSLRGKVALMVTISSSGAVSRVNVRQNTLGDASVISCMTAQARRWTFPKPDGGSVTVAKTFVFAPQG